MYRIAGILDVVSTQLLMFHIFPLTLMFVFRVPFVWCWFVDQCFKPVLISISAYDVRRRRGRFCGLVKQKVKAARKVWWGSSLHSLQLRAEVRLESRKLSQVQGSPNSKSDGARVDDGINIKLDHDEWSQSLGDPDASNSVRSSMRPQPQCSSMIKRIDW